MNRLRTAIPDQQSPDYIAPAVLAALIASGGSIGTSLFGSKKQSTAPSLAEIEVMQQQMAFQRERDQRNQSMIKFVAVIGLILGISILIFKTKK